MNNQCAETTKTGLRFGKRFPISSHFSVKLLVSTAFIDEPYPTKSAGILSVESNFAGNKLNTEISI